MLIELIATFLCIILASVFVLLYKYTPRPRECVEQEWSFEHPIGGKLRRFPSLLGKDDEGEQELVSLSVVVPAFREKDRLPPMLTETIDYLERRRLAKSQFTYELIIVDDGSNDGDKTAQIGLEFARRAGKGSYVANAVRVLRLVSNRGKGGAVTGGMLRARGRLLLMADADGATRFSDVEMLEQAIGDDLRGIAVGSRAHLTDTDAVVARHWLRNVLMQGFHLLVYVLGVRGIADTQCGFKMFGRDAARRVFANMHVEGWIFDCEMLHIAQVSGFAIHEVPVHWEEKDGSKIELVWDSIRMARDLLIIRLNYALGRWVVQ
jgi:dolichyl-phosphate beta-glucosyltransferase